MASGFGESTSMSPESSCFWGTNVDETGDFECNICFELAQDPIVTLCGHLYCWPCLYRWLNHHSHSHECPVCKALIQEEKLVPLYGRGKTQADPRSKSYPGNDIPNRPAGQRPETAPLPQSNYFPYHGFGLMGGFGPSATAMISNLTLFGSLSLLSQFNTQLYRFPGATMYGTTSGFPNVFRSFHGGIAHEYRQPTSQRQHVDKILKNVLLIIGFFVVFALIWW
ncbi:hypothetical protein K2173_021381 [Erythroxylum novogranatense]|uniref:E3 ubiquitin-protein ligase RMA n=1 Tax=Erythroxylum novogranatense TaxID=1862640 RepID=A0AAV8TXF6_9ROSI|nr:hypothetical protein K2173_021381 [Erythroxylum novogranatense]